jgi:predicted RNA-binding Zn ribbon-like protein
METGNLAELQIIGGHPALDLANTVAPRQSGASQVEFLSHPAALLEWAHRLGIVDTAELHRIERAWSRSPGAADSALGDVLDLRQLVDHTLAGRDLGKLSRRWAEAIGRSTLQPADGGGTATLMVGTDAKWMIGDRLADALVDLLRNADLSRLRVCPLEEEGCGWLFLDRSRNLSRKWCSMDDCGAHAKARRLTERRRARR